MRKINFIAVLLFILITHDACKVEKGSLSNYEVRQKKFIFKSDLREITMNFTDTSCLITNKYTNEKVVTIDSSYDMVLNYKKLTGNTLLVLNNKAKYQNFLNRLPIITGYTPKPIFANTKKFEVGIWDNDNGFFPYLDTIKIFTKKGHTFLSYFTENNNVRYNFIWVAE